MGGKSKPVTQTTKVELPPWLDSFAQENIQMAKDVTSKPFKAYEGQMVAGVNPMMQDSYDRAAANAGSTRQYLEGGYNTVSNAMGIDPQNLDVASTARYLNPMTANSYGQSMESTDGMIRGGQAALAQAAGQDIRDVQAQTMEDKLQNIGSYMNPYVNNVVDAASRNYQHQFEQNLNNINDRAASVGAFGNSRRNVMQGAAAAENSRLFGDFSANQYANAFDKAAGYANRDIDNDLTSQRSNQATDLQRQAQMASIGNAALTQGYNGQQLAMQGYRDAGQLANAQAQNDLALQRNMITGGAAQAEIGNQIQQNAIKDISLLNALGSQSRDIEQQGLAAQRAEWDRQQNYDLQRLNTRLTAAGMTPHGQTQTSTQTGGSSGSGLSTALGIGGMLTSLLAAPMTGGTSLLGVLAGSDEDLKTDIKKVGKDKETGVPLYSYRYKGDPKTYPKVVGPMAQDVEKVAPDMVTKTSTGKRAVNLGFGPMRRAFK
jgi:hypothetical protein